MVVEVTNAAAGEDADATLGEKVVQVVACRGGQSWSDLVARADQRDRPGRAAAQLGRDLDAGAACPHHDHGPVGAGGKVCEAAQLPDRFSR